MDLKAFELHSSRWKSCGELRPGMDASANRQSHEIDHV
jgi:hypothetical protein